MKVEAAPAIPRLQEGPPGEVSVEWPYRERRGEGNCISISKI